MNINPEILDRVIFPTAAFAEPYQSAPDEEGRNLSWTKSTLNPKNRIDSLAPLPSPKWRIDGCSGLGLQFHAIPVFLSTIIPLRIDVFIPNPFHYEPYLRAVLQTESLFYLHDSRVASLGISNHIVRALEYWTDEFSISDFKTMYKGLPFGSRIQFQNMDVNIHKIRVEIIPNYALEKQLLSLKTLGSLWTQIPDTSWPPTVDISNVHLIRQLYDSTSLVKVQKRDDNDTSSEIVVFKALTSYTKYLYHELKVLLTMPPHPNIISHPLHLIIKRCSFGGKVAILGFTTMYHQRGTLRDILPFLRLHRTLDLGQQLKWAIQITSALIHIRERGRRSYSDLRLDNVLLSGSDDIVMVDFEQRGLWCSFAAPEVNYLDYMHTLARSNCIPISTRLKYEKLVLAHNSNFVAQPNSKIKEQKYDNSEHGYWEPWLCLSGREQESAEVFGLGRTLWCIFEGVSAPETSVWVSYPYESSLTFPEFSKTPLELRKLIKSCVSMDNRYSDWGSGGIRRRGNKLVLRNGDGFDDPDVVQKEAGQWWRTVLKDAEVVLQRRLENRRLGKHTLFGRPTLREVLKVLESLQI